MPEEHDRCEGSNRWRFLGVHNDGFLVWSDPIALLAGIAATLAGIVFYGSSRSTREQITEKIRVYEARRAELIDGMDLLPVKAQ
jgi:hypothetical protein